MDASDQGRLTARIPLDKVPAKYATLKQAEAAGLCVPKSLLIDTDDIPSVDIVNFLDSLNCLYFIVRSANLAEDGSEYSLAGHFWSSEAVSRSEVIETINHARLENRKVLDSLGLSAAPYLIVQEYIEHGLGGVLFSPWSFFADYAFVEYSEQGVKSVVEGSDSYCSVLCTDEQYDDPLPISEIQGFIKPLLLDLCAQLRRVFDFPVDCEWAYDTRQQRIIALQVRPQTHLIGPVFPYNDSLPSLGRWQFTALSESLGRISPLSYSLLKQLYSDAQKTLQQIGCKAESVNFMHHAPDGTVLVDSALEANFYKMTLFGGFKRGLKQTVLQNAALQTLSEYDASTVFSYDSLSKIFQYWLLSNVLSDGAGRNNISEGSAVVHAYELMWPAMLAIPTPPENQQWETLNRSGRALFLYELNKLKTTLAHSKQEEEHACLAFCTWEEYSSQDYSKAPQRQHAQAQQALYDHALISSDSMSNVQSLSSSKVVSGELFVIANPSHFNGQIPDGCILVASYFDNRWVGCIGALKGIVVNKGSRLSHSAIVAREHGVPYYVVSALELQGLSSGELVTLDAGVSSLLSSQS